MNADPHRAPDLEALAVDLDEHHVLTEAVAADGSTTFWIGHRNTEAASGCCCPQCAAHEQIDDPADDVAALAELAQLRRLADADALTAAGIADAAHQIGTNPRYATPSVRLARQATLLALADHRTAALVPPPRRRCGAPTRDGHPCRRPAALGESACALHNHDRQALALPGIDQRATDNERSQP